MIAGIREVVSTDEHITGLNEVLTMYMGPQDILLTASVDFDDHLPADEVEQAITDFERVIKEKFPDVKRIFIEAQSWGQHHAKAIAAGEMSGEQPSEPC